MKTMNEFTIETAAPPRPRAGRPPGYSNSARKVALVRQLERLQPGQVLRWRSAEASHTRANNAIYTVRTLIPAAGFRVRKEDGGFDIYRTA